jgi:hypothetical protein
MASFVREVLSASGRLSEKEDYFGKATRLQNGIDDLKVLSNLLARFKSGPSGTSFRVRKCHSP